jgi:hypothetical protein
VVSPGKQSKSYMVPTYKSPPGRCWYHFLHGNVPGHQIDFIYRPEVPEGPLTRQHFSHLSRLVRYIEPWSRSAYAFAIGNLSRDDTQYEPGRGAVALIFGLRIHGAKDHAGRQDPPFCHALAAVDRHLDEGSLLETALSFHRRLLPDEESQAEGSGWYHTYVRHAQNTEALLPLLRTYVADFESLPAPGASRLGLQWTAGDATPPKRVVIVHDERDPFEVIAACAARIAGVLVASDIRWTAISTGREADLPGGVSVRFVPAQDVGAEEAGVRVFRREDVPENLKEIAGQLFGAHAVVKSSPLAGPRVGWRQLDEKKQSVAGGAEETRERTILQSGVACKEQPAGKGGAKRSRARVGVLIGLGVPLAIGGVVAAVGMGTNGSARDGAGVQRLVQTAVAVPTATATEAVRAALPAEMPVTKPETPVRKDVQGAPSAVALGGGKRLERRAAMGKRRDGEEGVYDIDVPQTLKR